MNLQSLIYPFQKKNLFFLSFLLLILSCSKSGNDDSAPAATLVSGLTYSPAVLELKSGVAGSSAKPTKSGSTPVTYSVSTSPSSNGAITIDGDGVIKASSSLAIGNYVVSVSATNTAGTANFPNVYTVKVTSDTSTPTNLAYSPSSLSLTFGTAGSSATPTITSSSAVTYSGSISPSTSAIIVAPTGVIAASASLAIGTYQVSITATNANGSKTFTNIYTITVSAANPPTTYNATVKALIQNNCGSCHGSGGPQTNYTNYNNAKNNIDEILRRINLAQGAPGMMPNGGTKLSQTTINQIQKWKDDGLTEQ